jgi:hypothetical protein
MKVSLDLHDFSAHRLGFTWIDRLREIFPTIKISMFYIPIDQQHYGEYNERERAEANSLIRTAVKEGIIELIPHGLTHMFGEFQNASYEDMAVTLRAYEEHFKELDLPYVKGFCAPQWLLSIEAIKCLDDNGWFLATDRNQPDMFKAKRNYTYNWSIEEPIPDVEILMGHGHMDTCSNIFSENIRNLIKIPSDAEWKFVSELI